MNSHLLHSGSTSAKPVLCSPSQHTVFPQGKAVLASRATLLWSTVCWTPFLTLLRKASFSQWLKLEVLKGTLGLQSHPLFSLGSLSTQPPNATVVMRWKKMLQQISQPIPTPRYPISGLYNISSPHPSPLSEIRRQQLGSDQQGISPVLSTHSLLSF